MRSSTPPDLYGLCPRCWQRVAGCLCAEIPRLEVSTQLVILRHTKESWRTSNTVRLLALAVPNTVVVEVGAVPEGLSPEDVRERTPHAFERYAEENLRTREELASLLGGEQATALLFPANRVTIPVPRPARLVVPDGSWRQARRIIARFPEVQQLPRFSLPPPEATQRRMRRPPLAEGMSTIEAVARALAVLEGEHVAVELEKLYTLHVERQLGTRRRNQRG